MIFFSIMSQLKLDVKKTKNLLKLLKYNNPLPPPPQNYYFLHLKKIKIFTKSTITSMMRLKFFVKTCITRT